ncbi:MAG TPA: T9SS type A sorting domain-containing protein [Phaeodactylibacter sp.]|nr:T9SS type A sorting domain-containing protein [Phaeodactylibacter sp.]
MKYLLLSIALLSVLSLTAQNKRSNYWIMGGGSDGRGLKLNFNEDPVDISYTTTGIWMRASNSSMCDTSGNYLFATNGVDIVSKDGELMLNGDSINPGIIGQFFPTASPLRQGVLAIPRPGSDSLYYVFNLDYDYAYVSQWEEFTVLAPFRVYCHTIDMSKQEGKGAVVEKYQVALQDTLARGGMLAARHANGCDWWIIVAESHTNCYYRMLVNAEGVHAAQKQCVGEEWSDKDAHNAVFTSSLDQYIRFNAWHGMHIFDFDNATGELSNPRQVPFPVPIEQAGYFTDIALSPNNQFAYIMAFTKAFQYDLTAQDIAGSVVQVAEWDGTFNPFETIFYRSALAPDGQIYVSSGSSTLNLHVIQKPNLKGLACEFVQRAVDLPSFNHATIPNMPFYGINNDTRCEELVNVNETVVEAPVALYPNPTSGELWVNYPSLGGGQYTLQLFNMQGQRVFLVNSASTLQQYDLSGLPNGTYFYRLADNRGGQWSSKILKVD